MTEPTNDGLAEVIHVYGKKVWIESDFLGSKHVMVQHDAPDETPFCYATFHYDHRHTSNSTTCFEALAIAKSLGATEPIEERIRPFPRPDPPEVDYDMVRRFIDAVNPLMYDLPPPAKLRAALTAELKPATGGSDAP